jgi:hypothetical protein
MGDLFFPAQLISEKYFLLGYVLQVESYAVVKLWDVYVFCGAVHMILIYGRLLAARWLVLIKYNPLN